MSKALRIVCDCVTTILLVLLIGSTVALSTISNPSYYSKYYSSEVVEKIEEQVEVNNEKIAEELNIEDRAFEYAVKTQIDFDSVCKDVFPSIFNGISSDFTGTEKIDEAYELGIAKYYEINDLSIEPELLNKAVSLSSQSFDDIMGTKNMVDLFKNVDFVTKNVKIMAAATLILFVFFVTRIFAMNYGRTKTFSHIGSVLISSGSCYLAMFLANNFSDLIERLNITENEYLRGAIVYGVDSYIKTLAIVGIVLIIIGYIAMDFVYKYYVRKHADHLQEKRISEKIRNDAQNVLQAAKENE